MLHAANENKRKRVNLSIDYPAYLQLEKLAKANYIRVGTYIRQLVSKHVAQK
jgi:hypothetical protein